MNTPDLKHGHVIPVKHDGTSLFDSIPADSELNTNKAEDGHTEDQVDVVAYNSLTVSWNGKCSRLLWRYSLTDSMHRVSSRQASSYCVARGIRRQRRNSSRWAKDDPGYRGSRSSCLGCTVPPRGQQSRPRLMIVLIQNIAVNRLFPRRRHPTLVPPQNPRIPWKPAIFPSALRNGAQAFPCISWS